LSRPFVVSCHHQDHFEEMAEKWKAEKWSRHVSVISFSVRESTEVSGGRSKRRVV